jgi:S-adenosylmethionine-diacylglycerol 3-amino-3-carboxypropyl transferase
MIQYPKTKPTPVSDFVFNRVHRNNLIYNTCWEDPRCDRALMDFDEDSEIVMITSAGCNALEYLLDHPKAIHAIDVNPRQNALLELKIAALKALEWGDLFQMFGKGVFQEFKAILENKLKPHLSPFAYQYWKRKAYYFSERGVRKTFYHHGTSGAFAWLVYRLFQTKKGLHKEVKKVFSARDMETQILQFRELEDRFLDKSFKSLLNNHLVMSMLGVPKTQQHLTLGEQTPRVGEYIHHSLNKVFTQLPAGENYFYRVYVHANYDIQCCPEYLKVDNQPLLAAQTHKIKIHTTTISDFLRNHPGSYSHFVLLDHQDWLSLHNQQSLEEEWRLILANSRPGTKILFRSAAKQVDFIPDFVLEKVDFEKKQTAYQHQLDRVGTYASVYLAIVR